MVPEEIDWGTHDGEELEVIEALMWYFGVIAHYTEPVEHPVADRHEQLQYDDLKTVPLCLHQAATFLGEEFQVDVADAQI
ncbi:hypothetical protein KDA14_03665 [Candidatus Saccharibacteria bacterium]|nr:hypothetical protein [Candidatus Saccharibacteria bacterium]